MVRQLFNRFVLAVCLIISAAMLYGMAHDPWAFAQNASNPTGGGGGGTPGGSTTDIQCNVSGALNACATGIATIDGSGNATFQGTVQVGSSANNYISQIYANSLGLSTGGNASFVTTGNVQNWNSQTTFTKGWGNPAWNTGNPFVIILSDQSGTSNRAADPLVLATGAGSGSGAAAYMGFQVGTTGTAGTTGNPYIEPMRLLGTGEVRQPKVTASGTAPGAALAKMSWVAGTNSGSCKLISYAGTSNTPVTVVDNVGSGC
jgi:hypothetical protein